MKRIISTFLILTMLVTMVAVAIPASAAPAAADVGNNVVTDDTRAAYVATLPAGAIAVANKEGLKGLVTGKYYYLTADITLGAGEAATLASGSVATDITIDGCGYTLTLTDKSLFEKTKNITVKNITFEGSITANNNGYFHILNRESAEGKTNVENVTASVDFTVNNKDSKRKALSVLGISAANSVVKNVLNEGNITFKANSDKGEKMEYIASLFGSATKTTFENVVNKGNITIEKMNISSAVYIGGIVGYTKDCVFKNCANQGAITSALKSGEVHIGGIAAYAQNSAEFYNCDSNGAITLNVNGVATEIGGILGAVAGEKAYFENCSNNGEIKMMRTADNTSETKDPGDLGMGIGGILGTSRAKDVTFYGCSNTKDITTAASGKVGVGGILGYQYIAISKADIKLSAKLLRIEKCTNSGNLLDNAGGGMMGGIVGAIRGVLNTVILDCVNTGDINTGTVASLSWRAAAGICGMYGSMGGNLTGGDINGHTVFDVYSCRNTGNITNNHHAGGILGRSEEMSGERLRMTFFNCVNDGKVTVTASGNAAGIYGYPNAKGYLDFKWCVNNGEISTVGGGKDAGGIISTPGIYFERISFTQCKNTADIKGGDNAGGIATKTNQEPKFPESGKVSFVDCVNLGNAYAESKNAGLAGGIVSYSKSEITLTNCINKGAISSVKPENAHAVSHNATVLTEDSVAYYLTGSATTTNKDTKGLPRSAEELDAMIAKMVFSCNNNPYNLNKIYEEAESYYKVDYTAETWKPFEDAVAAATAFMETLDTAEQEKVDKIVSDIRAGIKGLVYSTAPLDFTKLEKAIEDGVDKGKQWYSFTWLDLFIKIRDARVLIVERDNSLNKEHKDYGKPLSYRQSDIDKATAAIYKAIDDLLEKPPVQGDIDVDKLGEWNIETLRPNQNTSATSGTTASETTEESTPMLDMDIDTNIDLGCSSALGTAAVVLVAVTAIGSGIILGKKRD